MPSEPIIIRSGLGPAPEPGSLRLSQVPAGLIARTDSTRSSMWVSTVAKWFPDKKGLVTGVVVMGFGVGAFMMSKLLAPLLLESNKGDLVPVFISLGVFFAVVLLPVTLLIRNPPAGWSVSGAAKAALAGLAAAVRPPAAPAGQPPA